MTKHALSIAGAMAGSCLLLAGCGGSGTMAAPVATTPPAAIVAATPGEVLAIARAPSDAEDPLRVATDALTMASQGDESSDPIVVGG